LTQHDLEAAIADLVADEGELKRHYRRATQVVMNSEPDLCAACGEARDCSTAQRLFRKYGT
jgi:hypothetical protein